MSSSSSISNMFADWKLKNLTIEDEKNHPLLNSNFFTSTEGNAIIQNNIEYYLHCYEQECQVDDTVMIDTLKELENALIEATFIPDANRIIKDADNHNNAGDYGFGHPDSEMSKYTFDFEQLAIKFGTTVEKDAKEFFDELMLLEADNFLAFLFDNAVPLVLGLSVLDEGLPPRRVNQT